MLLLSPAAAALSDAGMMILEDDRPLGPGERMKHAWVWWPGKMTEPLRCAQYVYCVKSLMEIKECKEVGMLCRFYSQWHTYASGGKRTAYKLWNNRSRSRCASVLKHRIVDQSVCCLLMQALGKIKAAPETAAAAAPVVFSDHAAAAHRKRHSDVLPTTAGLARGAAAAAVAAAVRRTRHGANDAEPCRATTAPPPPPPAAAAAAPAQTSAELANVVQDKKQQLKDSAGATQPPHAPVASKRSVADVEVHEVQKPQSQQAQELPAGKRRRVSSQAKPAAAAAGSGAIVAARDGSNKHVAAAVQENQKVMQRIDDVVKQVGAGRCAFDMRLLQGAGLCPRMST